MSREREREGGEESESEMSEMRASRAWHARGGRPAAHPPAALGTGGASGTLLATGVSGGDAAPRAEGVVRGARRDTASRDGVRVTGEGNMRCDAGWGACESGSALLSSK